MAAVGVIVRPFVRTLRRLDHALGRAAGRRRVLIEARTPLNLAVLRPVLEPLLGDARVRLSFTGEAGEGLGRAVDELGVRSMVVSRATAAWMRADLYINSDPWNALRLRRTDKQLNFFHGVAGKYDLDQPAGLPLDFGRYDRVAFPNEGRRDNYVRAGIVREDRAVLVGYPKADVLVRERGAVRPAARLPQLDAGRPTAIFAPTFSPASALHHAGIRIVETLLAGGCNVIVKLHDRSLDPDPRYSGGIDWRARLSAYAGPHFMFAESGDSTPYLLASDLMVTDHSSIGFEFCALDRPLIVFDAPGLVETARINLEKVALLRGAARVVSDPAGLAAAIREAVASPQSRAVHRGRAVAEVFYRPGSATARALELVYRLLDLPPAADAVQPRPARVLSTAK